MPSSGTPPSGECASARPGGAEWQRGGGVGEHHELCPFSAAATKGVEAEGGPSPLHVPLFVSCVVLAALLLLTLVAFTTALLHLRKRSGEGPPGAQGRHGALLPATLSLTLSTPAALALGTPMPLLVTHSTQRDNVPLEACNDYREAPANLPKGPGGSGGSLTVSAPSAL